MRRGVRDVGRPTIAARQTLAAVAAALSHVVIGAFGLPRFALAQHDTPSALASRDSALVRRHGPLLISTLRRFADAQMAYRTTRGGYSGTLVGLKPQFVLPMGVDLAILRADDASWRAVAVHDSVPGLACRMTGGGPSAVPEDTAPGRLLCRTPWVGALALRDTGTAFEFPQRDKYKPPPTPPTSPG